jgi:hypothetical protein
MRSETFNTGITLVEKVLGEYAYAELFKVDLRRNNERCCITYFLSRSGFQRVTTSVGCCLSSGQASVGEAVRHWHLTEEFEALQHPLIQVIRETIDSFAESICEKYEF